MSDFEFVFALYSLLLGLSMVELLGGLGRALEARFTAEAEKERFAIGWLTPLLAVFVMLDLLSFWASAWRVKADVVVSSTALMAVVAFAGLYFLAARLVFPSHPEGFANLDTHYFRVRRLVFGLLLVLLGAQLAYFLNHPDLSRLLFRPFPLGMTLLFVGLVVAAMGVKGRRASIAILSLLIARYIVANLIV